jgi:hypothetical protein
MKVIVHQTPGVHLPAAPPADLSQRFEKQLPIPIAQKNRLPPIPPAEHMVNRSGILDPQWPWHFPNLAKMDRNCQYSELTPSLMTPSLNCPSEERDGCGCPTKQSSPLMVRFQRRIGSPLEDGTFDLQVVLSNMPGYRRVVFVGLGINCVLNK